MVERTKVGSQPKIVAVDIFCGLGGLSLGLTQSGISVGAGIDLDPACRYTFERNIGARFINQDVYNSAGWLRSLPTFLGVHKQAP